MGQRNQLARMAQAHDDVPAATPDPLRDLRSSCVYPAAKSCLLFFLGHVFRLACFDKSWVTHHQRQIRWHSLVGVQKRPWLPRRLGMSVVELPPTVLLRPDFLISSVNGASAEKISRLRCLGMMCSFQLNMRRFFRS